MFLSFLSIPLHSLNFCSDWNLHPWEFGVISQELQESLALNGIIHPPIVIAESNNTYAIVSGAKRLKCIRELINPSQVTCLVIKKDAPHNLILNLLLSDQCCTAELSLAEKAQFIEIARRFMKTEDIVPAFQQQLRLKDSRSIIPKLLKILQQDDEIIQEVHAGRLQERILWEILSLPEKADRLSLVHLFKDLCLGDGKQRRFFTLLRDIAYREGLSLSAYLQKEEIREILDHKEMNIPQKNTTSWKPAPTEYYPHVFNG